MNERPPYGTAPIRCGKTKCKWRGLETDLKDVPAMFGGITGSRKVCPTCGCDSYSFMTPGEIKAQERAKAKATSYSEMNIQQRAEYLLKQGVVAKIDIDPALMEPAYVAHVVGVGMLPCGHHKSEQSAIEAGVKWLQAKAIQPVEGGAA